MESFGDHHFTGEKRLLRMRQHIRPSMDSVFHFCYDSNLAKFRFHFPNWQITIEPMGIFRQLIANHSQRLQSVGPK